MSLIDDAVAANATIANEYDPALGAPPAPKIAIVTCADPRLSGIVRMLGLADADVDMIRNVGTVIDDDSIRSLVISTRVLGTREIMIINHNGCGMTTFTDGELEERLRDETGMSPIAPARFYSFTDPEQNTREQMQKTRSHPWIAADVSVRGFIFDVDTGRAERGAAARDDRLRPVELAGARRCRARRCCDLLEALRQRQRAGSADQPPVTVAEARASSPRPAPFIRCPTMWS